MTTTKNKQQLKQNSYYHMVQLTTHPNGIITLSITFTYLAECSIYP